ncbi:MAG TPA: hypothetical protein VMY37_40980 [Thermoguttaceae bacterium]|nr:hypothetical protein [Thermoguttaceae bacterium]
MKSRLFYTAEYAPVQDQIKGFLNSQGQFLSSGTVESTRAVGDAIQHVLGENFQAILGAKLCTKYSSQFARRAMADLAFEDADGFYYVVDVKTHRLSTKFNMPNLTSVERLSRFYEDDKNYFVVLMVAYEIENLRALVERVTFVPIEFLGWDCLTIGALGWGQIQIANSNRITVNPQYSRKSWMIEFCDTMLEFYPKEIAKIDSRIERFKRVREAWEKRTD